MSAVFNDGGLTTYTSDQKFTLGTCWFDESTGKGYKYVKIQNTTATSALVAGDTVSWGVAGAANFLAVSDMTDAGLKPVGAGVLTGALAGVAGTAEYGWVQVSGPFTSNQTANGAVADGDALMAYTTTDGMLTLATAADDPICAYADDESADLLIAAFH
jgi:hypothetical protein